MQIVNAIIETARLCNLDKDVTLPEADSQSLDLSQRDAVVGAVYRQLMEIESRLLPAACTPLVNRQRRRKRSPPL